MKVVIGCCRFCLPDLPDLPPLAKSRCRTTPAPPLASSPAETGGNGPCLLGSPVTTHLRCVWLHRVHLRRVSVTLLAPVRRAVGWGGSALVGGARPGERSRSPHCRRETGPGRDRSQGTGERALPARSRRRSSYGSVGVEGEPGCLPHSRFSGPCRRLKPHGFSEGVERPAPVMGEVLDYGETPA